LAAWGRAAPWVRIDLLLSDQGECFVEMDNLKINDLNAMIRIAKKYYEMNMSQEEISQEEDISKSSVSRILKKAVDLGYVRHEIIYPVKSVAQQEQLIKRLFDIEHLFIVPRLVDNRDVRMADTCRMAAQDLNRIIADNDIVSLSWGRTMEKLSSLLVPPAPPKKGISFVQLNGSIATNILSTKTASILERFTEVYAGIGYLLAAPVLVDDKEIADAIKRDSRIRSVLDMARAANIAIFSIGQLSEQSVLIERGAFAPGDVKKLSAAGAVGDICSRYFDIRGNSVKAGYDERTIGVDLDELRKKKQRIGIAVGTEKADAIIGTLAGGYLTSLYMDETTAAGVLKRCEELGL
jgi:deoxyribonucleoside regulator